MSRGDQRAEGREAEREGPQGRRGSGQRGQRVLAHPDVGIRALRPLRTGFLATSMTVNRAPSGVCAGSALRGAGCPAAAVRPGARWLLGQRF